MPGEGNFWDNVEPSSEEAEKVEEPAVPDYMPRNPQEIHGKIVPLFVILIILVTVLLTTGPFALASFGVIGQDECWDTLSGSNEFMSTPDSPENQTLHCVGGDSDTTVYSFLENHVIATHSYGYYEIIRWEILGDGGVVGNAYFDNYYEYDDNEIQWHAHGHCEWMGGGPAEVWYCAGSEEMISIMGYEYTYSYCEYQDMNWYCTDSFGQSSNFSDTSNETRAGPEVLDKWVYSCMAVSLKSPFDENTTMEEVADIETNVILPNWCYGTPVFSENTSVEPILPFYGESVYLYPNGDDNYGSIDIMRYSEDSFRYQMVSLHTYNADGTLTEDSENAQGGLRMIGMIFFTLFYLVVGYFMYFLSTGKHHIEHLGTENTLVISKSWRNKSKTLKSKISLDSSSLLEYYTVTSSSTDSEGHTSTSTSEHHRIRHSGRDSDDLPNGFKTEDLLKLTGLELTRS